MPPELFVFLGMIGCVALAASLVGGFIAGFIVKKMRE